MEKKFAYAPIVPYLEKLFILPNGELIRLEPHQKEILTMAFTPNEEGLLPYRTFVYSCPKKSGKSQVGSCIASWYAFSGIAEPNDEIYCCVSPNTNVALADGQNMKISEMVSQKHPGPVISLDESTGKFVERPVTNWFKNPRGNRAYLRIDTDDGIIELTEDHKLLTQRGWIEAGKLDHSDKIATSYYEPTGMQEQIIIGSMLGDGGTTHPKENKHGRGKHPVFRFSHRDKQKDYFHLKAQAMGDMGKSLESLRKPSFIDGREVKEGIEHVFHTPASPVWDQLHEDWHDDGRKIVPRNLELTPLSLAVWFLDDGTFHQKNHNGSFATHCFTKEEVEFLANHLRIKFNIDCKALYIPSKDFWLLLVSVKGMTTLSGIISSYVPESMRYKLSPRANNEPFNKDKYSDNKPNIYHSQVRCMGTPKINRNTLYCIEVEGTHNFMSGRLITANCANDLEQAQGRVYRALKRSIEASPLLRGECKKIHEKGIELKTGTTIQALSGDYAGAAGANPGMSLFDELWGATSEGSRRLYEEMTPPPTRKNSVRVVTTYSGFVGESILLEEIYKKMVHPEYLAHAELPIYIDGDTFVYWDHIGRMPWQTPEYYEAQKNAPGFRLSAYRRIHLNEWVHGEEGLDMDAWDKCVDLGKSRDYLHPPLTNRTLPMAVGVDAATQKDRAAVCSIYRSEGKMWLGPREWWQPSKASPLDFASTIEHYVKQLAKNYFITAVYYDPWQMESVAQNLRREGIPMTPFSQTVPNLVTMSEFLAEKLTTLGLVMYPDDELRREATMATLKEQGGRGRRIIKDSKTKKIDSIIALAMALIAAERHVPDFSDLKGQILGLRLHR